MTLEVRHHNEINPTNIINDDLFFILEIQANSSSQSTLLPPIHRHPYYEIIFVTQGECTVKIDFKEYILKRGVVALFSPSQIHQPIKSSPDYKSFLMRFYPQMFDNKLFFSNINIYDFDTIKLQEHQYARAKMLLEEMMLEFKQKQILKNFAIGNLLKCFLISLQRALPETITEISSVTTLSQLNSEIVENEFKITKPSEYAKKLKIPSRSLNSIVKEQTGLSCGEYIRSKTLFEAQRLLCYTNHSIKEIAYILGFDDVAYFSRFFKKSTHSSPLLYREKNCPCNKK